MMRHLIIGFACLVYLSITVMTGAVRHEHADRTPFHHRNCVACELQTAFVADVPVFVVPVIRVESVAVLAPEVHSFCCVSTLFVATASRAPPVAAA